MIVENQKNLKVHFAGCEQITIALCLGGVNVKYMLFSVFPFISEQFGLKGYPITAKKLIPYVSQELERMACHVIMDSGLFTLMFGAHAGKRDRAFMNKWYDALVGYVLEKNYRGAVVEIDSQKVLGTRSAWDFRRRMSADLPNRIINVFHWEDGRRGLDRLIEFSDYIALSIPELRLLGKKGDAVNLANYIKKKKPEIDIHLLGCTEMSLLKRLRWCTSSDSTAWQGINRYGGITTRNGKRYNKNLSRKKINTYYGELVKTILKKSNTSVTPERLRYYGAYCLAGEILKKEYTNRCGSQE